MLYVNFEDERLIGMVAEDLNLLLEVGDKTIEVIPAWKWLLKM